MTKASTNPKRGQGKNKKFLLNRLQAMYGEAFHPIMNMAENAVKLQKAADAEPEAANFKAALDGWEKIAQYVEPKLKAIDIVAEVTVDEDVLEDLDTLTTFLEGHGVDIDEL